MNLRYIFLLATALILVPATGFAAPSKCADSLETARSFHRFSPWGESRMIEVHGDMDIRPTDDAIWRPSVKKYTKESDRILFEVDGMAAGRALSYDFRIKDKKVSKLTVTDPQLKKVVYEVSLNRNCEIDQIVYGQTDGNGHVRYDRNLCNTLINLKLTEARIQQCSDLLGRVATFAKVRNEELAGQKKTLFAPHDVKDQLMPYLNMAANCNQFDTDSKTKPRWGGDAHGRKPVAQ